MKVHVDSTDDIHKHSADSKGRINLGTDFANHDVTVAILEHEPGEDDDPLEQKFKGMTADEFLKWFLVERSRGIRKDWAELYFASRGEMNRPPSRDSFESKVNKGSSGMNNAMDVGMLADSYERHREKWLESKRAELEGE